MAGNVSSCGEVIRSNASSWVYVLCIVFVTCSMRHVAARTPHGFFDASSFFIDSAALMSSFDSQLREIW